MRTAARIPDTQQTLEKTSLYRRDYYTWARQQVAALKRRDFDAIDWENVTEEMQALVTSQESRLRSQYARVMEHFLKLQYRDAKETEPLAGWRISIDNARMEIEALLQDSPGLQSRCEDLFHDAWRRARRRVINAFAHEAAAGNPNDSAFLRERKRLTREWSRALPQDNPYNRQQVEDPDWMPERARLSQRPQSRQQSTPKIDWDR